MITRLLIGSLALLPLMVLHVNAAPQLEKAVFAGGCFWCMEPPFEKLDGVKEVVVRLYRRHTPSIRPMKRCTAGDNRPPGVH